MSTGKGQEKAADASAATAQKMGNQYNAQQQRMYGMLFGTPGTGGAPGTPGSLNAMMDPNNLNVTKPTGVYGQQYTNAKQTLANLYGKNNANIKSNAAQAGFGSSTPAGFTQTEQNQNANDLANAEGTAFQTATNSQYQDALKNFWNSIGVAQNTMNQGQQGALQGTQTAANTYANLYGNAAKNSGWANVGGFLKNLGSGVGSAAGGILGA